MTIHRRVSAIAVFLLMPGFMDANAQPWNRPGMTSNVLLVAESGPGFRSIQAALDTITDASEDNPYLVYVTPGVYEEQVDMKPYVDIEGAGESLTKILSGKAYAIKGSSHAELRSLTLELQPPGDAALWTGFGQSVTVSDVTIKASHGRGIDLWYAGPTVLKEVRIENASGFGIRLVRTTAALDGVSVLATGPYGIVAVYAESVLDITNSIIVAEGPGSQGILGYGVTHLDQVTVLGGACGITVGSLGSMAVRNSEISGGIRNFGVAGLAHSELNGAVSENKAACFSVHDAGLNTLDENCEPIPD